MLDFFGDLFDLMLDPMVDLIISLGLILLTSPIGILLDLRYVFGNENLLVVLEP